jgi:alpha-N-arabinofuranosidase
MEYSRFASWVPDFGVDLALIAAGPSGDELEWTRGFFSQMVVSDHRRSLLAGMYGWALHYYCGTAGEGQALDFDAADWYALLVKANRMEDLIKGHWDVMGEFDKDHRVKLLVDEWGAWHQPGSEVHETHLFGQTSTMRDALVAALTLDTFNRHADKVVMGNVAQLVNNLHSLFLAHEERFVATPNFHVFEMYSAHRDGTSLRTIFESPALPVGATRAPGPLWGLGGSASLHGRRLVLTVVNPSVSAAMDTEIAVRGARIEAARASVLSGRTIQAHNTFDHPDAVMPRSGTASPAGGRLVYSFPPASVVRLDCELG